MLDMYSLLFLFPHSIRGSLHITLTCTCIGLWPPVNHSCHSQHGIRALGSASLSRCNSVLAADDHSGHHLRSSPLKQIAAASASRVVLSWIDFRRSVRRSSSAWTNFGRIPLPAATQAAPASLPAPRLSPHSALACCRRD
jgi:hypothetical protein